MTYLGQVALFHCGTSGNLHMATGRYCSQFSSDLTGVVTSTGGKKSSSTAVFFTGENTPTTVAKTAAMALNTAQPYSR